MSQTKIKYYQLELEQGIISTDIDVTFLGTLATKVYVDGVKQSLDIKDSVRAAMGTNVSLTPGSANFDGVTLVSNNRILLFGQTNPVQNGIYIFNGIGNPMTRSADANTSEKVTLGLYVYVENGTINSNKAFVLFSASTDPIVLDTSELNFTQFSGSPINSTDDVPEGLTNKYYTDARVKTYSDTLYSVLAHTHTFASLTSKPTTLVGYGITDAYPLSGNPSGFLTSFTETDPVWLSEKSNYLTISSAAATYSVLAHTHTFASLTSKPTTISGYGITDFNSLGDARWSLLAHTHTFASLTSKPTTISGYGISDFDSLWDARLALKSTTNLTEGTNKYYTDARVKTYSDTLYSVLGHTHVAADITSGVIAPARLGTGTASGSTYLRGDGTWATISMGAVALSGLSDVTITSIATGNILRYNGTKWVNTNLIDTDIPNLNMSKITAGNLSWSRISSTPTTIAGYGILDAFNGVYSSLTGIPSTFAPSAHTHTSSQITDFDSTVISRVLTGLSITGGNIVATDTILQAFGKTQNQINGLIGGTLYKGTWDASTNSPSLTSSVGSNGNYYIVSADGSTNIDGITDWKIGDWIIFSGTKWTKIDNTDAVISVNSKIGIVTLTTTDISEGTNKYYTDARVKTYSDTLYSVLAHTHTFASLTSKPTTLVGYGITDAYPLSGNPSGFLTSFTETDPIYIASSWYSTTNNNSNWNTAYAWGNHANAGYIKQNSQEIFAVTTGSANTYSLTLSPVIASYVAGQTFNVKFHVTNTGASTININGNGAQALQKDLSTALENGDIPTDVFYQIIYTGTAFLIKDIGFKGKNTSARFLNSITDATGTGLTVFNINPLFSLPRLSSTCTIGQVWMATDSIGNGSFQTMAAAGSVTYNINRVFIDTSSATGDTYGNLTGVINGTNKSFTVSQSKYVTGKLSVWLNGVLQAQGTDKEWVEDNPAAGTFTFNTAPPTGSDIICNYIDILTVGATATGGTDRQVQFNNAGNLDGANGIDISVDGNLSLKTNSLPSSTPLNRLQVYSNRKAGQDWLEFQRNSGERITLQEHFGINSIARWSPSSAAIVLSDGMSRTSVGGISTPALVSTNLSTSIRRWTMTSANSADSVCDERSAATLCWRGNGLNLGGFNYINRISLTTVPANSKAFFGLSSSVSAFSSTLDPINLTDVIGFGFKKGVDTNWQIIYNDASGTASSFDTGSDFPISSLTNVYTFYIACAPYTTSIFVRIVEEVSGKVFEKELTSNIPSNDTFLSIRNYMNNGGTPSSVEYDCAGVYLSTNR